MLERLGVRQSPV
ncbi:hypothetical protein YQE_01863, partial [Dendroctonus ponderosae]